MAGNFSFLKTKIAFSRMAFDQMHEQKNKYVKFVSSATSLVNRQDESTLFRWDLWGTELCRILHDFEGECDHHDDFEGECDHHDDKLAMRTIKPSKTTFSARY